MWGALEASMWEGSSELAVHEVTKQRVPLRQSLISLRDPSNPKRMVRAGVPTPSFVPLPSSKALCLSAEWKAAHFLMRLLGPGIPWPPPHDNALLQTVPEAQGQ